MVVGSFELKGYIMVSKKTENVRMCKGHNAPLLNCIGQVKESEFYTSWSKFSDGKVPYCKKCVQKIYQYYLDESKIEKTALYFTLMKLDIPFIQDVFNTVVNKSNFNSDKLVGTYINELQKRVTNKEIWCDFSSSDIELKDIDSKIKTVAERKHELNQLEHKWGLQDCVEDYDFLETTFNRYTNGIEFINPQQEDLYKDLCRDRLLLRKINDNRYGGEETIDKVQNRISKTMSTLKLDQFERQKDKSDIEKILEKQIWEIENTEPAEVVDKNEYKDFLNIESDWGNHILRAVRNLLTGSKDYPNITKDG